MTPHDPDEPLQKIEAAVLSLVLARIVARGRLKVEQDLRELEELAGTALPEVRAHFDHLFGFELPPAAALPAAGDPADQPPVRRPPGRPKKAPDLTAGGPQ